MQTCSHSLQASALSVSTSFTNLLIPSVKKAWNRLSVDSQTRRRVEPQSGHCAEQQRHIAFIFQVSTWPTCRRGSKKCSPKTCDPPRPCSAAISEALCRRVWKRFRNYPFICVGKKNCSRLVDPIICANVAIATLVMRPWTEPPPHKPRREMWTPLQYHRRHHENSV